MARATGAEPGGDRIEGLLEEVRGMVSPPAWSRVEELLRAVLDLHRGGLGSAMALLFGAGDEGARLAGRLAEDERFAALLLLHDLHPDDLATRVGKALARVRPYLDSHGGDVELLAVDAEAGAVSLRMKGSCDGCPSSALTVKLAVEGAIRDLAPEVERIDVENVTREAPRPNGEAAAPTQWVRVEAPAADAAAALEVREVDGARLVLCRLDGRSYAYRDGCPGCGAGLGAGALDDGVLACPACDARYDLRRAGRGLGAGALQLGPVPLLEGDAGVDVALAGAAS